ncbi:MAG: hypothetical protein QGF12_08900 [SAR202 cluster bacterium]|jgi:hypothetical protein|nr:hypothetical protein [SAR202 cluster bacterium]
MLVLIAIIMVFIPGVAIAYPLIRGGEFDRVSQKQEVLQKDLNRRWEEAITGLQNVELEMDLGGLNQADYGWLRERYMTDAALVLKEMNLENDGRVKLSDGIESDAQQVRDKIN